MCAAIRSTYLVTTDGVRLHVLEAGPRDPGRTPVLAFVPGWSMPASIWLPQLTALGSAHRVAALDPRGQGDSEVPSGGYDIGRRAEDINEFIARYDRAVLVGWSLGALEALHCVHRFGSDRLDGMVLVDSSVGEDPPPPSGTGFIDSLRKDRVATLRGFVRDMFVSAQNEGNIDALTEAALRMPLEASLALFPRSIPREHWRDTARAFDKPLLYVVTQQFAAQARNLLRHRQGTRVEIFEHAGHAVFIDEPQRFNRVLTDFFTGIAQGRAT